MQTRTIQTRYGPMYALAGDRYITGSLEAYGEYGLHEAELFGQIVKPGMVVVEAGANIGTLTLPLARLAARVYAFEPQQAVFHILCANLVMNGVANVVAYPDALGAQAGRAALPPMDYSGAANFGGVSVLDAPGEVRVAALDDFELPRVDLIKVDVEGWELEVLKGAKATIGRSRPLLYVENDRATLQPALIAHIDALGYRQYWHVASLHHPQNFNGVQENLFHAASLNMLCLPRERATAVQGFELIDPSNWRSPLQGR